MEAKHQSGFTLYELMVTLLVAGVLLGIGVPSFKAATRNSNMTAAANDLITGLLAARAEAVKRQVPVTLCASANPSAANPVCSQNGAGTNGGFIVWVDWDPAHLDANQSPTLSGNDGNAAVDANELVLIRSGPPPSAAPNGTLNVWGATTGTVSSGYVSFGANGFVRQATGVAVAPATLVLYCDDRGRRASSGGNAFSSARLVRIDRTGRANVQSVVADIGTAVPLIPNAVCPP
jgi:type IV fimbrial biogenesis protein FimT